MRLVNVLPPEFTESISETLRVEVSCTPEFIAFFFPEFKPLDGELAELKPFWASDSRIGHEILFSFRVSDDRGVMCIRANSTQLARSFKERYTDGVRFPRSPNVHSAVVDHFQLGRHEEEVSTPCSRVPCHSPVPTRDSVVVVLLKRSREGS